MGFSAAWRFGRYSRRLETFPCAEESPLYRRRSMSQNNAMVTSTPPGPRFPIRDVQVDLIDRLTPSVEDEELLSLKLDENEIVVLNAEQICSRFPNLTKVSVCYNHIKRIDMFQWFTNLRELHLTREPVDSRLCARK